MTEPTVDDLPAEADSLQVVELELGSIADEDVREPHRHAYHELIWIREGHGQHLIDGEPVEFGPHTLTLIAKGQVHQFKRAEDIRALVARFDDDWLEDGLAASSAGACCSPAPAARRWAAGGRGGALRRAARPTARGGGAPRQPRVRGAPAPPAVGRLLWAQRWREAQLEEGGATRSDVQLHQRFLETLERDFATNHDAGHYAASWACRRGPCRGCSRGSPAARRSS